MKNILRRTKARWKASLETGLAGTFYWDIPHDLVITDENIAYYFSLPETAMSEGVPIKDVVPAIFEKDRARILRSLAATMAHAEGYQEEFRVRLPAGAIRWLSARCTIRRDDGHAIGLSGLVMDITERKKVEEALVRSEAMLAAELQMMHELYYAGNRLLAMADLQAALKEMLAFAIRLLGADSGDIQWYRKETGLLEPMVKQGITADAATAFQYVADADTVWGRAAQTGNRVIVADIDQDTLFPAWQKVATAAGIRGVQSTPILGNRGKLLGVLSTYFHQPYHATDTALLKLDLYIRQAVDFIVRMQAEEALSRSEENYRVIVNQSIAGILKVDFSGNIVFSNEQFGEMLGYRIPELLQLTVLDIIYEEDIARNAVLFERLASTGEPYEIEKRLLCKDGSIRWVNNQISPIFDHRGKPDSAVIISVDITRQKAVEKQKDEFIGMASHELKTPLTGIKAYGQLLNREFGNIDEQQSAALIMKLNGQIDRMVKLVYALLDTTMISGGELALQKETFDLHELIKEQLNEARLTGPTHYFSHQPCGRTQVTADRERIGQVLTNLLSNAIKYSTTGSEISVQCENTGEAVKVSVSDHGIGLSAAMQEKVFDRFFRVDTPASVPIQGFGLGLYIAAQIIKKHHGVIGVKSAPGDGSEFYFTLPL